jgi:surfeit locus 1 family protein
VRPRIVVFIALAVALAAVFVRLGFWQLDRLGERRQRNVAIRAVLSAPAMPFAELPRIGSAMRQAVVVGVPDYANDFVLTGRSRDGSPGVHIFTPVRIRGNDTAVLVNRGWVYAPDAATIDLPRWRESRATFRGYTVEIPAAATVVPPKGRAMRMLNAPAIDSLLPYPFFRHYVVARDSMDERTPARLEDPDLGEGPHLSYAIQWFTFAIIALVGAGIVARKSRLEGRQAGSAGSTGA